MPDVGHRCRTARIPAPGFLKLRTEAGQEVLLPLSEGAAKQVQKVTSEFNRSRDLLFVEARPVAAAPLQ
jgi:hypothetical protein